MTSEKDFTNQCLNCEAVVQEDYKFCAKCSQRLRNSKISVWSLLSEFVSGIFNLDSRLFQSFSKLFRPGTLTTEYIAGKRKRYLNPARFFLFSMVFGLGVLAFVLNDIPGIEEDFLFNGHSDQLNQNIAEIALIKRYDSLITRHPIDTLTIDSFKSELFQTKVRRRRDSIRLPSFQRNGTAVVNQKFHIDDILNMEEEAFLDHYNIETWKTRFLVKRALRSYLNPSGAFTFFIGNLIWAVILSQIFLSFVMKLLYIRKKRFFVEHLILLMHIHCFILIMGGIVLLIDRLLGHVLGVWLWGLLGISALYFFISMYRYYGEGFVVTFFKFLFLMFAYLFIGAIFTVITLLISMLVF